MTRFVSRGYRSIVQNFLRLTLGVTLVLATGCDRSDLVALRVRELDAGANGGASASSGDASLLGAGGAFGNMGGSGGVGGVGGSSGGIGGAAAGSGGGGIGGIMGGDASIGSGDAGVQDAGSDSSGAMDAGAEKVPDAWVPQTCAVGSAPTPAGCTPVSLATKVSVGFVPCRIRTDGTLWCWGQPEVSWTPSWQEPVYETQVGNASDWTSVTVGEYGICGTRAPGTLWCLGRLFFSASSLSTPDYENQPVQVGADDDWLQISAGREGFCGIKENGTLWCWGSINSLYPTGSTSSFSATPVQVGTDSNWSFVSTTGNQTCALRTNGSLECFGLNNQSDLGDGTTTSRSEPKPILATGPWVGVGVGVLSCGLRFDGTLWCWGPVLGSTPVQIDSSSDWTAIAARATTTGAVCGLRAGGRLMCNDPSKGSGPLSQIDAELGYTSVAVGCAEHQDGTLRCWGRLPRGDGSHSVEPDPVRVGTATDWTDVVLSGVTEMGLHAGGVLESRLGPSGVSGTWLELSLSATVQGCAIRADHTLWCWGGSWVQQGSATDWLHVTVGIANGDWGCGIREGGIPGQGTLWCSHQLSGPTTWVQADSRTDWVALSRGHGPCGIHADGSLTCWTFPNSNAVLTDVGTDHDWASVSAPEFANCGIKTDESLWCWGSSSPLDNAWGQLGDGTRTSSLVPKHVAPGTHWAEVASGNYSMCGIQTDGSLWCWGNDTSGQLGLGVPGTQRLVPTRVGNAVDWQHVAMSGWGGTNAFACGIRSGQLWCWGANGRGGFVSWSPTITMTPHVVVDPPPPGGGQFCPWPIDNDLDGYAACLGDCDDKNADVNPYAVESCNGIDDNCDGAVDEGCP